MASIVDRVRRSEELIAHYPKKRKLQNDGSVELRLMSVRDEVQFLHFARALPLDDLLFEQRDITNEQVVQEWIRQVRRGQGLTVLAYRDGKIAGEASLEHSQSTWTEHRGEIRIVIAPSQRGQGLGGVLAQEVFALAKELELELLTAQMIASQNTAQAVFRGLGFEPVAVLPAFAVDQRGQTHDLVVMMRDLSSEGSEVRTAIEGAKTLLNKLRGH